MNYSIKLYTIARGEDNKYTEKEITVFEKIDDLRKARLIKEDLESAGDTATATGSIMGYRVDIVAEPCTEYPNGKITVSEWADLNPDRAFATVWAADTRGGFGRKGQGAYGDAIWRGEVHKIEVNNGGFATLHIWLPEFGPMEKEATK